MLLGTLLSAAVGKIGESHDLSSQCPASYIALNFVPSPDLLCSSSILTGTFKKDRENGFSLLAGAAPNAFTPEQALSFTNQHKIFTLLLLEWDKRHSSILSRRQFVSILSESK